MLLGLSLVLVRGVFEEVLALAQEIQKFAFKYWRERSRPLKTLLP